MKFRRLGSSGARVSVIALGTDNIVNPTPEAESIAMIHRALDSGINLIDTSNSYAAGEAERVIGKALAQRKHRSEAFIATKFHYPVGDGANDRGNSRVHILRACEDSLKRLAADHIDLYQLHRPDFDTPSEETLSALNDLVRQGKVRYLGASTSPAWRTLEGNLIAKARGWDGFVSEQDPYNLLDRRIENEMVSMALAHGVGILAWSPLAMGVLAGRYPDPIPQSKSGRDTALAERPGDSRAAQRGGIYAQRVSDAAINAGNRFAALARDAGFDPAQAAIAWLIAQPGVVASLIGPKSVAQLDNLLGVPELELSPEFLARCDEICPPGSVIADFHNSAAWMKMSI